MTKFGFVFFGSDSIATSVLNELEKAGYVPSVLVCGEDKPKGRGLVITAPPAKIWAEKRNIPVLQPKKLDDNFISQLATGNWQLGIVASYGKIIPKAILDIPENGFLNVHPSLLPKLRGASPIESTILNEDKAGVTIIKLDEEMDHGSIVAQKEIPTNEWPPHYKELERLLGTEGGKLLAEIVKDFVAGKIKLQEQDHSKATFTKKIKKEDGLIDLSGNPETNLRKIRAFEEWPGAYFFHKAAKKEVRVKIADAHLEDKALILDKVIPEGKKEMSWQDFLRGN